MSKIFIPSEDADLEARLKELPVRVYENLRAAVKEHAQVSRATFHNVLKGDSRNTRVILTIASFLNCTFQEVLDPDYEFQDPRDPVAEREALARQLGLVKARPR